MMLQTHFCSASGKFSSIDLSFCDPRLTPSLSWEVLPHSYGSDHFPIRISYASDNPVIPDTAIIKWKHEEADWTTFTDIPNNSDHNISPNIDTNTLVNNFTKEILQAAEIAIPKKNTIKRKPITPWWNKHCKNVMRKNKQALYAYRKRSTQENLTKLKKTRAQLKRIIRQSKKISWRTYINTINKDTPIKIYGTKYKKLMEKTYHHIHQH